MKKFIIFANNNDCPDFFITNDGDNGGLLDFAYLFNQQTDSFRVIDGANLKKDEDHLDKTIYGVYQKVVTRQGHFYLSSFQFTVLWIFAQFPWFRIAFDDVVEEMIELSREMSIKPR